MRQVAQPVAVITAHLPPSSSPSANEEHRPPLVHGATVSSFTTISMNPPLVAFSLRSPSRLANALQSHPASSSSSNDDPQRKRPRKAHFLINLLYHHQADIAAAFARPGLHPLIFDPAAARLRTASSSSTPPPSMRGGNSEDLDIAAYPSSHTLDNVPALRGSMSALACRLAFKLDLGVAAADHSRRVSGEEEEGPAEDAVVGERSLSSELFVARVCAVEREEASAGQQEERDPLVYCRHKFWTIGNGKPS
ncbi:hypothetical protein V8E36_002759 [Tilletia maclaganii]